MTVAEFEKVVNALVSKVEPDIFISLEEESLTLTNKIRQRVKSKGTIGEDAVKTSDYSTLYGGKWKKKREKEGLQTAYKDLHFSPSGLFTTLKPRERERTADAIRVLSSVDKDATNRHRTYKEVVEKLSEQESKRGSLKSGDYVTNPINEEMKEAQENVRQRVINLFKQYGL